MPNRVIAPASESSSAEQIAYQLFLHIADVEGVSLTRQGYRFWPSKLMRNVSSQAAAFIFRRMEMGSG